MIATSADLGDAELMLLVQTDEVDAFEVLFDRFALRAYRVAHAIARNDARTEDIVQDAFLSIWRTRASYRPERGTVVAWLMGIVRNRAIDSLRLNVRHDIRRADEGLIDQRTHSCAPEHTVAERDQAAHLRSIMAQLPDAQRDVIALAYFGELSTTEIAGELSLPLGTVKGRMRLGLEKLRGEVVRA